MRFASFLSPALEFLYRGTVEHIGERLGIEAEFVTGHDYDQFVTRDVDAGFICGLPYVRLAEVVEPLAAPVVDEPRYAGRPVYFSDVVVAQDHPATSFRDLRGAAWCYNEPNSHSGYLTVLRHLGELGQTPAYFGRFDAVGFHARSLELVADRIYDASAIDSHLLAVVRPEGLRTIDSIGPSPIQPFVAGRHLDAGLREALADAIVSMEGPLLQNALVARYVRVTDDHYASIRDATCRFLTA